jgi:hypothetical protein
MKSAKVPMESTKALMGRAKALIYRARGLSRGASAATRGPRLPTNDPIALMDTPETGGNSGRGLVFVRRSIGGAASAQKCSPGEPVGEAHRLYDTLVPGCR